jgi:hypothetical protein
MKNRPVAELEESNLRIFYLASGWVLFGLQGSPDRKPK